MAVKDAILSRRSIFKFKEEPVPNDVSVPRSSGAVCL